MATKKGRIFIVSAPSGSGKTTLCEKLFKTDLELDDSVSMTTRPSRPGEVNGRDYYFVSKKNFLQRIKEKGFLEWTTTYGWYYGTPKDFFEKALKKGRDILLSIDVKGAMRVKRLHPEAVLIFIEPPSVSALKQRLYSRNQDGQKEIKKRLSTAKKELSFARRYDYCVINDNINSAMEKLKAIIIAERCKFQKGVV